MISLEKLKILTPLQKLTKNVATGFEKLPSHWSWPKPNLASPPQLGAESAWIKWHLSALPCLWLHLGIYLQEAKSILTENTFWGLPSSVTDQAFE